MIGITNGSAVKGMIRRVRMVEVDVWGLAITSVTVCVVPDIEEKKEGSNTALDFRNVAVRR